MEEQETQNHEDQNLIQEHVATRVEAPIGGAGRYFTIKFACLLIYLLGVALKFYPSVQLTIVSIFTFVEFWLCKNVDGLELVGMRWSHEIGDGGDPRWVFYSRRDPYVPEPINSNIFWIGLFGGCTFWFCVLIWALFDFTGMNSMIAAIVLAAHVLNTVCFLKCHSISSKQADDVARSVLLGEAFDSDNLEKDSEIENINIYRNENNVDDIHLQIEPLEDDTAVNDESAASVGNAGNATLNGYQ